MIYAEMLRLDADVLLRETSEFTKQERWATARLLVRLAAVEKRELYAPCGYSSMWEYCLGELQMSEESAGRRLWAARKCREFPALFDALTDGRINLTAVHTLATHLTPANMDELVAAAAGRTKAQLLDWLACRFPRAAVPTEIRAVAVPTVPGAIAPTHDLLQSPPAECKNFLHSLASVPVPSGLAKSAVPQVPLRDRAHVDPLNAEQVRVRFTMSRRVLAKMRQAQDLLGNAVARDDVAALFEKLLDMAIPSLEKKKFAATNRPRALRAMASTSHSAQRGVAYTLAPRAMASTRVPHATTSPGPLAPRDTPAANPRTIPAHVKREVWKRDGGQCTFRCATGRRCACTRSLEFDHVRPVALGGEPAIEYVRLLCRKHNQLEAERRLGAEHMRAKRLAAQRQRAAHGSQHPHLANGATRPVTAHQRGPTTAQGVA